MKEDFPYDATVKGRISDGIGWTDTNGENFVVFSRSLDVGRGGPTPVADNEVQKTGVFVNHFIKFPRYLSTKCFI